jgi:phosphotransferase system enzyme I (PtsI)/phosphotransferase system enzyme I (PtsP)
MPHSLLELSRIMQLVSMAKLPGEQVKTIVDSIANILKVDVCSLYLVDALGDMLLVSNYGLDPSLTRDVRIPSGKGLVGLTARSLHPLNIANVSLHSANYPIKGIDDSELQSFCGVPMVRAGEVIGVLVAQTKQAREFSAEDEAFLLTLASQLALINIVVPEPTKENKVKRIKGIKASPGISIGHVYKSIADNEWVCDIPADDIDQNLAKWRDLFDQIQQSFIDDQKALAESVAGDISTLFEAYTLLVKDPIFTGQVETLIMSGRGIVIAIQSSVDQIANMFLAIEDTYLRSRSEDIQHIGRKLLTLLCNTPKETKFNSSDPIILVGEHISVTDIANAMEWNLVGVVSGDGSALAHAAVLANALGVPSVMGVENIAAIHSDERIIIDGNNGALIIYPTKKLIDEYGKLILEQVKTEEQLLAIKDLPGKTLDEININLYTNTGLLADIAPGLLHGAEGVGLYRTEIPFMMQDTFPTEDEQAAIYQEVMKAYDKKPVYMRVLDIGSDKQLPYYPITGESNPAMGWRGIRFVLDNSSLLMSQLRAMLKSSHATGNLHILVPMVSDYHELEVFHLLLDEACAQLNEEGLSITKPPVGIMIEVPVAVSQFHLWADKLDFVSIGSNDLSQYLLAMDRNNSRVANRYDAVHPGVLAEINAVVSKAKELHLPLSVCGELACDPVAVIMLLGMGVRTFSMSASKLLHIKALIRRVKITDCQTEASKALNLKSAFLIRQSVQKYLDEITE